MTKHNTGKVIDELPIEYTVMGEQGPRIYIAYKGREFAANVSVLANNTTCIAHLEDGITGESVELTAGIRRALKRQFIKEGFIKDS